MNHFDNFIKMLSNQKDVKETNWDLEPLKFVVQNEGIKINVESESVSFHFDKDGRFIGICNYK